MDRLITFLALGAAGSAAYAIAAAGLVVTYSTSGIFNFAHGATGMVAAFTYAQMTAPAYKGGMEWHPLLAFIAVVFVIAPLWGAAVERVLMRGITDSSEVTKIVVTVSLMLALLFSAVQFWEGKTFTVRRFFDGDVIEIANAKIPYHRGIMLGTAVLVALALWVLLRKSRLGIAMRAVVDDRPLVQLCGANPGRLAMASWAIGSMLAALAGILIAGNSGGQVDAIGLTFIVVNAYAAAVFGKLKSLPLTVVGAMVVGIGEAFMVGYGPQNEVWGFKLDSLQYVVSPIVLFVVMLAQPQVRLRAGGVKRVRERFAAPSLKGTAAGAVVGIVVAFGLMSLVEDQTQLLPLLPGISIALLCLSLVPLTGYAGQLSLAQMTFFGIGAILMTKVGADGRTAAGVFVALGATAIIGALVALPALRLSGIYLALATTAFATFCSKFVFANLKFMPNVKSDVPNLQLGFVRIESVRDRIMVVLVAFCFVAIFLAWLRSSSWGRRLIAMKDSPVACATLGMNLTQTKIGVFALSSAIAGLSGALAGRTVLLQDLDVQFSMAVTTMAVVGGIGAIGGAFLGGMMLGTMQNFMPTLYAKNAVGVFDYVSLSVPTISKVAPGLIGIGLGRNPNGLIAEVYAAFRRVGSSRASIALSGGGLAAVWVLARSHSISNWTFVALVVVILGAVIPLVPILLEPIEQGRAALAGAFLVASLVVVGAVEWEDLGGSIGARTVYMVIAAAVIARVAIALHGRVPQTESVEMPSPDMVGVDRPMRASDALEAELALGITEKDWRVHA